MKRSDEEPTGFNTSDMTVKSIESYADGIHYGGKHKIVKGEDGIERVVTEIPGRMLKMTGEDLEFILDLLLGKDRLNRKEIGNE